MQQKALDESTPLLEVTGCFVLQVRAKTSRDQVVSYWVL